eukprot:CAMPEP_0195117538 /NCGR_PEP_ID=MMETSP0448-20130528/114588_1 /TAXON_ID=66468 /ORGANISM="Heterocapsa triquestra, Strain CCMP 448" /LENGTH=36 /DNA_ID= /DNA_START= /DNA_END= /DNA_ORIENTATION=
MMPPPDAWQEIASLSLIILAIVYSSASDTLRVVPPP